MNYLFLIAGLVGILVTAGFVYQWLGSHYDQKRFASAGRFVTIGNRQRLYLLEMGSGEATVLFESGIAATNLNWLHIQQKVSRFASTASYDRSGLGWSSPCHTARTPSNIAEELHKMLSEAGIKPPYVLVGHSFGGLVMRKFALLYPQEVSSLILVDPVRAG